MTSATARRVTGLIIGAAMVLLSCADIPTKADLPPETELVYPGATETDRFFSKGETGNYLNGESKDATSRLTIDYDLSNVGQDELFAWYETELTERGWTTGSDTDNHYTAFIEPEDDLLIRVVVTALENLGQYRLRFALVRKA